MITSCGRFQPFTTSSSSVYGSRACNNTEEPPESAAGQSYRSELQYILNEAKRDTNQVFGNIYFSTRQWEPLKSHEIWFFHYWSWPPSRVSNIRSHSCWWECRVKSRHRIHVAFLPVSTTTSIFNQQWWTRSNMLDFNNSWERWDCIFALWMVKCINQSHV